MDHRAVGYWESAVPAWSGVWCAGLPCPAYDIAARRQMALRGRGCATRARPPMRARRLIRPLNLPTKAVEHVFSAIAGRLVDSHLSSSSTPTVAVDSFKLSALSLQTRRAALVDAPVRRAACFGPDADGDGGGHGRRYRARGAVDAASRAFPPMVRSDSGLVARLSADVGCGPRHGRGLVLAKRRLDPAHSGMPRAVTPTAPCCRAVSANVDARFARNAMRGQRSRLSRW